MKLKETFIISVIVPIYNVEKFLPQCIDSILVQSVTKMQIILIDDGSTDESGAICDFYAKKDSRVTVIHQKNKGVSAARNAGLKIATGTYIAFVDSDDMLPVNAYKRMLDREEADLIIGRMQMIDEAGILGKTCLKFPEETLSTSIFLFDLFDEKKYSYLGFLWDKLFSSKIIREGNIHFKENIRLNEDRLFLLEYVLRCSNIHTVNDIVYYYRQRNSSVINKSRHCETITDYELTVIDSFKQMQQICRNHSMELYYVCCRKSFESALDLLNRVAREDGIKRKRIKHFLKESAFNCLKNPQNDIINKLKIIGHAVLER